MNRNISKIWILTVILGISGIGCSHSSDSPGLGPTVDTGNILPGPISDNPDDSVNPPVVDNNPPSDPPPDVPPPALGICVLKHEGSYLDVHFLHELTHVSKEVCMTENACVNLINSFINANKGLFRGKNIDLNEESQFTSFVDQTSRCTTSSKIKIISDQEILDLLSKI